MSIEVHGIDVIIRGPDSDGDIAIEHVGLGVTTFVEAADLYQALRGHYARGAHKDALEN
jgi:hypothetical protein